MAGDYIAAWNDEIASRVRCDFVIHGDSIRDAAHGCIIVPSERASRRHRRERGLRRARLRQLYGQKPHGTPPRWFR